MSPRKIEQPAPTYRRRVLALLRLVAPRVGERVVVETASRRFVSDEFGNPEHRIDKIGGLVASRPA